MGGPASSTFPAPGWLHVLPKGCGGPREVEQEEGAPFLPRSLCPFPTSISHPSPWPPLF